MKKIIAFTLCGLILLFAGCSSKYQRISFDGEEACEPMTRYLGASTKVIDDSTEK